MLKLTRHLFCWDPKAEYADYYERALYNHILCSQNPETGMMCYYVPLRSGSHKEYNTPLDSFWCCTGTGVENHAKYGDSIYFHNDNTLWVNLFIASELNWKAKGLKVRQETRYPEEAASRLVLTVGEADRVDREDSPALVGDSGFAVKVNTDKAKDSSIRHSVPTALTLRTRGGFFCRQFRVSVAHVEGAATGSKSRCPSPAHRRIQGQSAPVRRSARPAGVVRRGGHGQTDAGRGDG